MGLKADAVDSFIDINGFGTLFLGFIKPDIDATRENLGGKEQVYVFSDGGIETEETDTNDLGTFIQRCIGNL